MSDWGVGDKINMRLMGMIFSVICEYACLSMINHFLWIYGDYIFYWFQGSSGNCVNDIWFDYGKLWQIIFWVFKKIFFLTDF
jgi:hypothetical protein